VQVPENVASAGGSGDGARWTAEASRALEHARQTGNADQLNTAVDQFEAVLEITPPGDPNHEIAVINLAGALIAQHELTDNAGALDRAAELLRPAWGRAYASKAHQAEALSRLGWVLQRQAEETGDVATINRAVQARRRALRLSGKLNPSYPDRLTDLGGVLGIQFSITGDVAVIKEAVRVHEYAVSRAGPDDPGLSGRLSNLGTALDALAMRTGDREALSSAVEVHRRAVDGAAPDDPYRAMFVSNLAISLMRDYELNDSRASLDESIERHRAAVAATPAQHVDRLPRLTNLAAALQCLYERTGELAVLGDIVDICRQAVTGVSGDHVYRIRYQYALASALARRGERTGDLASLDEAVVILGEVADRTPSGHPNRLGRLSALAMARYVRFLEIPEDLQVLDSAIEAQREALRLTPEGHALRGMFQSNLGAMLSSRFEYTGDTEALREALGHHREAVAATPDDHSEREKQLANLAICLILQARHLHDDSMLNEALELYEHMLGTLPAGDSGQGQTRFAQGAAYSLRFELTGDAETAAAGITAYQEVADDGTAPAHLRIKAGRDGGRLAARTGAVDDALVAFGTAVRLMDEVAWIGITRADQERLLGQLTGLPMDAAAMAIQAGQPEYAVELLEQGRGVLLARQLEAPGRYAVLRERAPGLARQLADLDLALRAPALLGPISEDGQPSDVGTPHSTADQRIRLAQQRDSLMSQIRGHADLEELIAPPRFSRLQVAGDRGPVVVVNISSYRCDALIIHGGMVRTVPLPEVTAESVSQQAETLMTAADNAHSREVTPVLGWLWDSIVAPVLASLGLTTRPAPGQRFPHLWWCATGPTVFLPLHAAGHYPEAPPAPDTALDLVVSSYTPTLRTLVQLRERNQTPIPPGCGPLIIAMPQTPGAAPLEDAKAEADDLASRFRACQRLDGPAATRAAVTAAMPGHPWAHFSCHGIQDLAAPSRSGLQLQDQRLIIQQISDLQLSGTEFAYLSACDTYRGGPGLPDEGVTLASALQVAGYQHVIAALWQISGITAPDIAHRVYDQITRNNDGETTIDANASAEALRAAVSVLREESPTIPPFYFAAYVHTGP
jgi:tetratricopeptide (TPR) repeat protein